MNIWSITISTCITFAFGMLCFSLITLGVWTYMSMRPSLVPGANRSITPKSFFASRCCDLVPVEPLAQLVRVVLTPEEERMLTFRSERRVDLAEGHRDDRRVA